MADEVTNALGKISPYDVVGVRNLEALECLNLQKEFRKTIVFITHDLDEALRLGDQIAILRDGEVIQQGTNQDIVLRPADDYIANFVKEVNRGRVVHVEAVMSPLGAATTVGGPAIAAGVTIEEAVRILATAPEGDITVVDPTGKPLGTITFRQLASAMVNAHDAGHRAAA